MGGKGQNFGSALKKYGSIWEKGNGNRGWGDFNLVLIVYLSMLTTISWVKHAKLKDGFEYLIYKSSPDL